MIHVAPCSCELHQALREALERNAELEADYRHENEGRRAIEALYTEQKARAEKAELANHELLVNISDREKEFRALNARHGECQARVAELEATLRRPTRDERVDEGRRVIEEREAD